MGAILAAKLNKVGWFCVAIGLILGCNAVLSLTSVFLNLCHPGFSSTQQVTTCLLERLKKTPEFKLTYQRDDVLLFKKKS